MLTTSQQKEFDMVTRHSVRRGSIHRSVLVAVTVLAIGACASGGGAATTTSTLADVTTSEATTTTLPPTTTTLPPTTTTTEAPSPPELRQLFLDGLDAEGWVTYTDALLDWSVRYPPGWVVLAGEPGEQLILLSGDPATDDHIGVLTIAFARDAAAEDAGSLDYLTATIQYSVEAGTLRAPDDSPTLWIDRNFDGIEGPLDIYGVGTSFAVNVSTGEPLGDDEMSPTTWYAFYDPALHPDYAFIIQTLSADPELFGHLDEVMLSFEPPPG
jgi:hypothetical protein